MKIMNQLMVDRNTGERSYESIEGVVFVFELAGRKEKYFFDGFMTLSHYASGARIASIPALYIENEPARVRAKNKLIWLIEQVGAEKFYSKIDELPRVNK